jgi:divalent metal cation (Fe/Co/Zn/Cd) transporter
MEWVKGNLFLLSIILVIAGLWRAYGALMWWLGLPPDDYPVINMLAAIACLVSGYYYFRLAMWALHRWQYVKLNLKR